MSRRPTHDARWYAVLTKARSEAIANTHLIRAGFWTFFPFTRVKRRRKVPGQARHTLETIELAYMPRYTFVLAQDGDFQAIEDSIGVSVVVRSPLSRVPLPIPDRIMDKLMAWADQEGDRSAANQRYLMETDDRTRISRNFKGKIGDKFIFGQESPFNGLLATIASLDSLDEKAQIVAELNLLGSVRQVTVPVQAIGNVVNQ